MDQYNEAEFAKNSENKEDPTSFTPEVREAGLQQGTIIYSKLYNTMLGELTKFSKSLSDELTNVLNEANITPSDSSVTQVLAAIKQIVKNTASGVQVGDILPNIGNKPPNGRMLCNGQTITNCAALFPDFYQHVINNTPYITLSAYQAQLNTYGQCGFCAVNGDDVRLPTITRPISGVNNISETGQAINATADKHVHGFGYNTYNNNGTFLFSTGIINVVSKFKKWISWNGSGSTHDVGTSDTYGANMVTSEPYEATAEVRGKQVKYPYCVVVYTASMSQALVNVQELIDLLKYQNQVGITSITSTSGSVNLASGGLYSMQINGDTTFSLPTPTDVSNLNQIFMQLHIANAAVIDWGTDTYFNEPPSSDLGYSNIIWEYDVMQSKWIVGQILKV